MLIRSCYPDLVAGSIRDFLGDRVVYYLVNCRLLNGHQKRQGVLVGNWLVDRQWLTTVHDGARTLPAGLVLIRRMISS
jgi:hypothetical protein